MDDMLAPLIKSKIVAMNPDDVVSYHYPRKVISQIIQGNKEEYVQVAQRINQMDEVQLVNIQHEFGIFGGEWGSHLITFVETLKKPVVINFHTALPKPNKKTAQVVKSLSESAKAVTVMTNNSKRNHFKTSFLRLSPLNKYRGVCLNRNKKKLFCLKANKMVRLTY